MAGARFPGSKASPDFGRRSKECDPDFGSPRVVCFRPGAVNLIAVGLILTLPVFGRSCDVDDDCTFTRAFVRVWVSRTLSKRAQLRGSAFCLCACVCSFDFARYLSVSR